MFLLEAMFVPVQVGEHTVALLHLRDRVWLLLYLGNTDRVQVPTLRFWFEGGQGGDFLVPMGLDY